MFVYVGKGGGMGEGKIDLKHVNMPHDAINTKNRPVTEFAPKSFESRWTKASNIVDLACTSSTIETNIFDYST